MYCQRHGDPGCDALVPGMRLVGVKCCDVHNKFGSSLAKSPENQAFSARTLTAGFPAVKMRLLGV
jgi:hypothetical protein